MVGEGSRVWAFAHILSGAVVGESCNICDHTFIEGEVRVGNRATVKCGVSLWNGLVVEDDVFIGPSAVFTNDLRPRSQKRPPKFLVTVLRQGCTIGANSTILPGLTIGRWSMVGAGAVVTRNVPDFGLVIGTPGRLRGWVCRCGERLSRSSANLFVCSCGVAYKELAGDRLCEV